MKNIDVLYIHPSRSLDNTLYAFMPIGIPGLLNLLKDEGYSVYGVNYSIEKSLDNTYSLKEELENIIDRFTLV